jgi:hypothetical protein
MGTIKKRGTNQYQGIIRLKGYPQKTKTHETEADARDWIRTTEARMLAGVFKDTAQALEEPFDDLLFRYLHEVAANHKGGLSECYQICAMRRLDLAKYKISAITPSVIREYRDQCLKVVKPGTVRRDLELIRAIFSHARETLNKVQVQ